MYNQIRVSFKSDNTKIPEIKFEAELHSMNISTEPGERNQKIVIDIESIRNLII